MDAVGTRRIIVVIAIAIGCAQFLAVRTEEPTPTNINRKLTLAAAKGELTDREVMDFRERIEVASHIKPRKESDRALTALSDQIDHARKTKRVVSRQLNLF
jgi:hypothetical protein